MPNWSAAAIALTIAGLAAADAIELRNGDRMEGTIAASDVGGVTIRRTVAAGTAGGAAAIEVNEVIGWDRVARLDRPGGGGLPDEQRWLEQGERLWRARMRLARGDASLAVEALGPEWRFVPIDGPTGIVVALVELHVALAANDRPRAWAAWLEAARLRRRGMREAPLESIIDPTPHGSLEQRPLFDAATGLCPQLPPFPVDAAEMASTLATLRAFDPRGDSELAALRDEIAAAIDPAAAMPPGAAPNAMARATASRRTDEEAVDARRTSELLRALRGARSGDPAERERARETLAALRRRLPEWTEAWGRYAGGMGLLLDGTPSSSLAAQIELLHLPARFAGSQPALAARAAAAAAEASRATGHADESERIQRAIPATPPPAGRNEPS